MVNRHNKLNADNDSTVLKEYLKFLAGYTK